MSLPIAPRHFKRYKEVAFLLLRHWGVKDEAVGDLDLSELDASSPRSHSLAADLERLGPTYVKLGQLLRTRPDLLPPSVYDDLGRLHDDVEAFAFSEAKRIVEEELGARLDTLFSDFEERPLAAASLGQVHRAALRDGTRVAVKVQRPDAERAVKEDLEVLGDVADFLASHSDLESRFGLCSTLREFQDHIVRELDYVEEARNLVRMAELVGDYEAIVVPSVVQDYSSAQVLTMDLIEGTNLGRLGSLALMERPTKSLAEDLFRCYLDQALLHP